MALEFGSLYRNIDELKKKQFLILILCVFPPLFKHVLFKNPADANAWLDASASSHMRLFIPYIPISRIFLRDQPKPFLYMTPRK
jgi:hypothetical protein